MCIRRGVRLLLPRRGPQFLPELALEGAFTLARPSPIEVRVHYRKCLLSISPPHSRKWHAPAPTS
jgi:hypothetical protein